MIKQSKKVKEKHVPMRTCIATGIKLPKNELLRLVRTSDGVVKVDLRSKLEGRGANISMNMEAFDLAIKKRAISRALKLEKPLTKEEIDQLRIEFEIAIDEKKFRPKEKPVMIRVKKEVVEKLRN
jgi:predicted RNA-binding protein YlxR (DUF448 family)